jgi:hypothetical protein
MHNKVKATNTRNLLVEKLEELVSIAGFNRYEIYRAQKGDALIFVDDRNCSLQLKERYPNVIYLNFEKNLGPCEAGILSMRITLAAIRLELSIEIDGVYTFIDNQ